MFLPGMTKENVFFITSDMLCQHLARSTAATGPRPSSRHLEQDARVLYAPHSVKRVPAVRCCEDLCSLLTDSSTERPRRSVVFHHSKHVIKFQWTSNSQVPSWGAGLSGLDPAKHFGAWIKLPHCEQSYWQISGSYSPLKVRYVFKRCVWCGHSAPR